MNIKKNFLLFLSIVFISTLSNAYANLSSTKSLFLNAEAGWSNIASGHVDPYQFKDKQQLGHHASMGYLFPINPSFDLGPEIGYGDYGKVSYTNSIHLISNYTLTGWDVLANLKYKPTEFFNVYFKAGVADLNQRLVVVGPNVTPGGFYQQATRPI